MQRTRAYPGPASPRASRFTYLAPGPTNADGNRALTFVRRADATHLP
jgi:hypothetical protein